MTLSSATIWTAWNAIECGCRLPSLKKGYLQVWPAICSGEVTKQCMLKLQTVSTRLSKLPLQAMISTV